MSAAGLEEEKVIPKICFSKECAIKSEYFKEAVLRVNLERQLKKLQEDNVLYRKAVDLLLLGI